MREEKKRNVEITLTFKSKIVQKLSIISSLHFDASCSCGSKWKKCMEIKIIENDFIYKNRNWMQQLISSIAIITWITSV